MTLVEFYLLKEGDSVIVYGKSKQIKQAPLNGTVKAGNKYYYYNEIERKL